MQEQINLSELRQAWFTRLETFAQKSRDYTTFMGYEMDLIDLKYYKSPFPFSSNQSKCR